MLNIKNAQIDRPLNLPWLPCFVLVLLLLASAALAHGESPAPRAYEGTVATITKISIELHQALDAKKRQQLRAEPRLLTEVTAPCIAPYLNPDKLGEVTLSATWVDLINRLAHARALEESASGYFDRYVQSLAPDGSSKEPMGKSLPAEQVWNFDTMNHQVSLFNQMVGAMVAIEMAHHYLGHFKKHPANATDATTPPSFTERVSEKEWREAVLKGARNALDCGLGVDGFRALLTAVEKAANRSAWTAYLVHPKAETSKLSRDLEKLEKDFFLVEK